MDLFHWKSATTSKITDIRLHGSVKVSDKAEMGDGRKNLI